MDYLQASRLLEDDIIDEGIIDVKDIEGDVLDEGDVLGQEVLDERDVLDDEIIEEDMIDDMIIEDDLPLVKRKIHLKYKAKGTEIQLYPYQVNHLDTIKNILLKSPFALDLSMLGTGKTYTSSRLYQTGLYRHLIVIAPAAVKTKWSFISKQYAIPNVNFYGYCELRSVKFKQPKHGLLIRRDYTVRVRPEIRGQRWRDDGSNDGGQERVEERCEFKASAKYAQMVNEGVLLVIDEIQNIRNITDQFHACKELIRVVVDNFEKGNQKSRVILLSGSPIDKQRQSVHLFRSLNIMKRDKLTQYNIMTGETMWWGISDIVDNLAAISEASVMEQCNNDFLIEIGDRWLPNIRQIPNNKIEQYAYWLFQNLFKPLVSAAMLPTICNNLKGEKIECIKANGYYQMEEDDLRLLIQGVEKLHKAVRFNPNRENAVDFGHDGVATLMAISSALLMIETSKIGLFTMLATKYLSENENQKVVICVNYTSTITDLLANLSGFNPLRLDGGESFKKRAETLESFQRPDCERRLLIGNLGVCSTGIDLDDQDGRFPRICLVNPNYSAITLYQLGYRFLRANTKSDSRIHFVFAAGDQRQELAILNALSKKSSVMKETTKEQVKHGVVFPGDYLEYHEVTDSYNTAQPYVPTANANRRGVVATVRRAVRARSPIARRPRALPRTTWRDYGPNLVREVPPHIIHNQPQIRRAVRLADYRQSVNLEATAQQRLPLDVKTERRQLIEKTKNDVRVELSGGGSGFTNNIEGQTDAVQLDMANIRIAGCNLVRQKLSPFAKSKICKLLLFLTVHLSDKVIFKSKQEFIELEPIHRWINLITRLNCCDYHSVFVNLSDSIVESLSLQTDRLLKANVPDWLEPTYRNLLESLSRLMQHIEKVRDTVGVRQYTNNLPTEWLDQNSVLDNLDFLNYI